MRAGVVLVAVGVLIVLSQTFALYPWQALFAFGLLLAIVGVLLLMGAIESRFEEQSDGSHDGRTDR